MKKEYCCKRLKKLLDNPNCPIEYEGARRRYMLTIPEKYLEQNEICMNFSLKYCPECGTEFPKELFDEWFEVVESQFGEIDIFDDEQIKNLPQEFKTEQWWRKRGL